MSGVGAPTALADETAGNTGDTSSTATTTSDDAVSGPKRPKPNGTKTKTTEKSADATDPAPSDADPPETSTSLKGTSSEPGATADATATEGNPPKRNPSSAGKKRRAIKPERAGLVTEPDDPAPTPTATKPTTTPDPQTPATVDAPAEIPAHTEVALTTPAPVADQAEPTGETTIIRAVAVDTPTANPATSPVSPATPVALSQLWTAAATTRRITEAAGNTTALGLPAAGDTTSEPEISPAAAVASVGTIQNSLTHTGKPSLTDQITVAAMQVVQAVSGVIGVDLFGLFGRALVTSVPPSILTFGLSVVDTTYTAADGEVWRVWELHPENPSGKAVVALHGGGFIQRPNVMQWFDYTNMARETGATVIVPFYPLATTDAGAAVRVIPATADFISQQIDRFGAANVSIYGDSSGANLAFLTMREMILRGDELPSGVVIISLAVDGTLSNPDIATIDDPVFDIDNLDSYANHWGDGIPDGDPRINYLLFEDEVLQAFPQTTIYQGSLEWSLPDVKLLHQRAVDLGAPISVVVGKGQIHDWALAVPINSQALVVRPGIYRRLGLTYATPPPLFDQVATFITHAVRSVAIEVSASVTRLVTFVTDSVTSTVLDLVSGLTKLIDGPPVLPPGSTVEVGTSSLKITETMTVSANWYFPEGDRPPDRMIWLQHGFLATGPMYSYTAAWLAENTHSIVVTPTLTSNYLAPGGNGTPGSGLWLGGDAVHAVVADLFVDDRAALTASALDAGYAKQYGLDPDTALLPRQFGLAGHSAGGALVSGVAGYLAENGAADDLVGVVALDGVPTGDQLPSALGKLADYEERTDRYIPFRNIGAPTNQFNTQGNINESLAAARPDHFNGVVLAGGAHTDSIVGGNPLIQLGMYLFAGFPEQRNTSAVQTLMADWFNDWFDGDVTDGDGLAPGSTLSIQTPKGVATGTVIGAPATATI
jgi:acetyl esterase/lipase